MSDPIWKEEERYSCKEKDADYDPLSLSQKKDAWLKQLESFSMSLQEFLLRQSLLSIKKMQRLEVFSKLVRSIFPFRFKRTPFLITSPPQNQAPHSPSASPSP